MQIINTYKCNFSCEHCLFTCSPNKRRYLDNYTLIRFMEEAFPYADSINYCGGEIFLNPNWEWQLEYLSGCTDNLRIVTNGSYFYSRSGKITRLLKRFISVLESIQYTTQVTVLISDDEFHDFFYRKKRLYPLDYVIERFFKDVPENVHIEKDNRRKTRFIAPLGRALRNNLYTSEGSAICESFDPNLSPDGTVYACCNMRLPVGNVLDGLCTWEENFKKIEKPKNCLSCKLLKPAY